MELAKTYEPAEIERRWYPQWEQAGYFAAGLDQTKPAENAFCILLPPPNVTGTLHMGHGFNQTIMDSLTRYYRMRDHNTLWQPGTDHAGIATQVVVERHLRSQGVEDPRSLGREAFVEQVEELGLTLAAGLEAKRYKYDADNGIITPPDALDELRKALQLIEEDATLPPSHGWLRKGSSA